MAKFYDSDKSIDSKEDSIKELLTFRQMKPQEKWANDPKIVINLKLEMQ